MASSDATLVALCRTLYPAVTTSVASDAYLTAWLEWAKSLVGIRAWGSKYDIALATLLAHIAYRDSDELAGGATGSGGATTSIRTLQMAASFGDRSGSAQSETDAELLTTKPGSRFLSMRGALAAAAFPSPIP